MTTETNAYLEGPALAVANWLEMMADHAQGRGAICGSCVEQALNVARVFLGTDR